MEKIRDFIEEVKEGVRRGEYESEKIENKVFLEVSVAGFQYGTIIVRLWVEDDRIEPEENMNFRRLHRFDPKYRNVQRKVNDLLNEVNETDRDIIFEPEIWDRERAESDPSMIPDQFNPDKTYSFTQPITIRDDVTVLEAMMTNREDGMTRSEIQDHIDDEENSL